MTPAEIDRVIELPSSWTRQPHQRRLRYFIPEWDDRVDPDFDFATDTHASGRGDWSNEVFAHQLYPAPSYDGLLLSRFVARKTRSKWRRLLAMGVHRYLRVPEGFPVMGDCGAFGYVDEAVPPYSTEEVLDYYSTLGFDLGVSIDHLIVSSTRDSWPERYELTLHNAEAFLREHRKQGLPWTPIAAVQGWDGPSYREAARRCVAMGYRYVALGGLVRASTKEILGLLEAVREAVPPAIALHLFGVARLPAIARLADLGVRSVDSASCLRRAWMGSGGQNYLTAEGRWFTAIRIPEAGKSFRAKQIVRAGRATAAEVVEHERGCLAAIRGYARRSVSLEETLDLLEAYDRLITVKRRDNRPLMRKTLEARPWEQCPCAICRRDGVEVIIFRGNNRNRRRGFHNTHVFYDLMRQALRPERIDRPAD